MYQLNSPGGSMTELADTSSRQSVPSRDRAARTPQDSSAANGIAPAAEATISSAFVPASGQANGAANTSLLSHDTQNAGQSATAQEENALSSKPLPIPNAIDLAQQEAAAT